MLDLFETSFDWSTLIHSNHNHLKRETFLGSEYWIHRKGCLSAKLDEPGVIPGSMGTRSFHVTGRGLDLALESSSHGAGRRLARGEAMRQISLREFHKQTRHIWIDRRRANSLRDEAPSAYKDIDRVMRAQRKLTRIVRSLLPVLTYKGT
jgi:tRNA-splicing ligase RtcB